MDRGTAAARRRLPTGMASTATPEYFSAASRLVNPRLERHGVASGTAGFVFLLAGATPKRQDSGMSDGELHILVEQLEAQIDELGDIAEGCRKWILLSKLAIGAGGAWLLAVLAGLIWFDPTTMVLAIAALLGGIVLAGSNASTLRRVRTAIATAEALRAQAIDEAKLPLAESASKPREIH